jgi:hypothetical protein
VSLEQLIAEQLAATLDIVGLKCGPAHAISLALATRGLAPRAEDRLDVIEERLADWLDDDRHELRVADP